jgi:hypothetical protein
VDHGFSIERSKLEANRSVLETRTLAQMLGCTLLFLVVVEALPSWKNAEVKQSITDVANEYDYIIVGAGTAGLTVADRLSEDSGRKWTITSLGGC